MSRMRTCPNCSVSLTRYEWSKLWWMSSVLTGRLVQPCGECGALIRLSALTLLTGVGAVGLIVAAYLLFRYQSVWLLVLALGFAITILIGVLGTRLETVPPPASESPDAPPAGKVDEL
jgi:hypothetical protein